MVVMIYPSRKSPDLKHKSKVNLAPQLNPSKITSILMGRSTTWLKIS